MTTALVQTISRAEVAFMLRVFIGPLRNWDDFLADSIRDEQSIAGLKLLPCGRQKDARGTPRPVYATSDVKAFIECVRKVIPSAGKKPIKVTTLAIDGAKHWKDNHFDHDGAPVARRSRIPTRYAHLPRHSIHWKSQF
jgi:hypothetical protein